MKLLVISQYYYPEQFRINEVCAELVRPGTQNNGADRPPQLPGGGSLPRL